MSGDTPSRRRGLGRGLSALMGDFPPEPAAAAAVAGDVMTAPIAALAPNPFQPRQHFDPGELDALASSLREVGLLQPILVRPAKEGGAGGILYEIIAGERRWRAAQKAGLHEVPVVVRDLDDGAALEAAIIENVQRHDLSPIEEAAGYRRLIDEFGHRQEDIARTIGRSRSHIANLLRLLSLPDAVQKMVDDGRLTMGHARALVGLANAEELARRILASGASVREAEAWAARARAGDGGKRSSRRPAKDADTRALEADLASALGLAVDIRHRGERGGALTIRYRSLEQLDALCQKLLARRQA
ncbi:MAG: ParB/RepB/Spo0J family partition protein [Rhodothalassiaceae bacterium]